MIQKCDEVDELDQSSSDSLKSFNYTYRFFDFIMIITHIS